MVSIYCLINCNITDIDIRANYWADSEGYTWYSCPQCGCEPEDPAINHLTTLRQLAIDWMDTNLSKFESDNRAWSESDQWYNRYFFNYYNLRKRFEVCGLRDTIDQDYNYTFPTTSHTPNEQGLQDWSIFFSLIK